MMTDKIHQISIEAQGKIIDSIILNSEGPDDFLVIKLDNGDIIKIRYDYIYDDDCEYIKSMEKIENETI